MDAETLVGAAGLVMVGIFIYGAWWGERDYRRESRKNWEREKERRREIERIRDESND